MLDRIRERLFKPRRYQLVKLNPSGKGYKKVGDDYFVFKRPSDFELDRGTWAFRIVKDTGQFGRILWREDIGGGGTAPEEAKKAPLLSINQDRLDALKGDIESMYSFKEVMESLSGLFMPPESTGSNKVNPLTGEMPPISFSGDLPSWTHPWALYAMDHIFDRAGETGGKILGGIIKEGAGIGKSVTGDKSAKDTLAEVLEGE